MKQMVELKKIELIKALESEIKLYKTDFRKQLS